MINLQDGVTVTVVAPPEVGLTEVGPALVVNTSSVQIFTQASPSASWHFTHNLGRIPLVNVYDAAGNQIDADVIVDSTTVAVVFATPSTGTVALI